MNRKSYSQILDSVARDHVAEQTDLAPRILARIQKGKNRTMQPRTKVFTTAFLILLVLAIILMGVPAVRAAIQRWIGYVPGIGLVSEGQIHILSEPVSITRDGVTLTIEQALVDSTQTTVLYSIEGLKTDMFDLNSTWKNSGCRDNAILRLGDDDLVPTGLVETSWGSGYQTKVSYPAISSTINEATLVLSCLRSAVPGGAPENWKLSFRLIPAPPDMMAFPVIEISTPVEATPTALPPMDASSDLVADGISLVLDRAVELNDGYLIYASLHWENTGYSSVDVRDISTIHLLDANGQEISFTFDYDEMGITPWQPGQRPLIIKTEPVLLAGPLTLVLDAVSVDVAVDARFTFDPGPNPQPDQVWEINQDIDVGHGHSLRILRGTYYLTDRTQANLIFEIESKTGVMGATIFDLEHPIFGTGGGIGSSPQIFKSGFYYRGKLPEGALTVDIGSISVSLPGHWQAEWTPPEPRAQVIPTPQGTACLRRESWQQALQAHASLLTGLTGTLALSDAPPPDYYYQVSVARLDASNLKLIGFGSAPSLSPDGTHVVYMGPATDGPAEGLYITNLASGNTSLLFGTTIGDMNPLWSPDGQKIAYTHGPPSGLIGAPGPYSIVVSNLDGKSVILLTDENDVNYAVAWMPDGNHILSTAPSQNGVSLHSVDIHTGDASLLFGINYNGSVAVSPDGKRLAFEEMLPLDKYGLFVSDLDGSNRKLLADGDPYTVTIPAWSPDGNWVIVSVHDPDREASPTLALIQVDACQIIPLPNLSGYVSSWIP